ncbi:MAG: hypothetical protein HQK49_12860 [Oligoflexia bacterium]|nr:hypothetical protein [Oligoflexia bacterium]
MKSQSQFVFVFYTCITILISNFFIFTFTAIITNDVEARVSSATGVSGMDESLEEYYKRSDFNFRKLGIPPTFGHRVSEAFKNSNNKNSSQKELTINEIKELYRLGVSSDEIVDLKNSYKEEIDYLKLISLKRGLKEWKKNIYELISLRSMITKEKISLDEAVELLDKGFSIQQVKSFFYIFGAGANLKIIKEINGNGIDLTKSAFFIKAFPVDTNNGKNLEPLFKLKKSDVNLDDLIKIKKLFADDIKLTDISNLIERKIDLNDVCKIKSIVGAEINLETIKFLNEKKINFDTFIEIYLLLSEKFKIFNIKDVLDLSMSVPNVVFIKDIVKNNPDLQDIGKLKILANEIIFPQEIKWVRMLMPDMTLNQLLNIVEDRIPLIEYVELKRLWPDITIAEVREFIKWGGSSEMVKRLLKRYRYKNFKDFFEEIRTALANEESEDNDWSESKPFDNKYFGLKKLVPLFKNVLTTTNVIFEKLDANNENNFMVKLLEAKGEANASKGLDYNINANTNANTNWAFQKIYPYIMQTPFRALEIKEMELDVLKANRLFEKKVTELTRFKEKFCKNLLQKMTYFRDLANESVYSYIFNEYISDSIVYGCEHKTIDYQLLSNVLKPTIHMIENLERDTSKNSQTSIDNEKQKLIELMRDLITYSALTEIAKDRASYIKNQNNYYELIYKYAQRRMEIIDENNIKYMQGSDGYVADDSAELMKMVESVQADEKYWVNKRAFANRIVKIYDAEDVWNKVCAGKSCIDNPEVTKTKKDKLKNKQKDDSENKIDLDENDNFLCKVLDYKGKNQSEVMIKLFREDAKEEVKEGSKVGAKKLANSELIINTCKKLLEEEGYATTGTFTEVVTDQNIINLSKKQLFSTKSVKSSKLFLKDLIRDDKIFQLAREDANVLRNASTTTKKKKYIYLMEYLKKLENSFEVVLADEDFDYRVSSWIDDANSTIELKTSILAHYLRTKNTSRFLNNYFKLSLAERYNVFLNLNKSKRYSELMKKMLFN